MKKLQIVLEVEVDEKEVVNVETADGKHITTEEFVKGLKISDSENRDSGAIKMFNEDEEYYLMNIGDGTRCMKNSKIVSGKQI